MLESPAGKPAGFTVFTGERMTLRELLEKLPDSEIHGDPSVCISSLTCDSRAV